MNAQCSTLRAGGCFASIYSGGVFDFVEQEGNSARNTVDDFVLVPEQRVPIWRRTQVLIFGGGAAGAAAAFSIEEGIGPALPDVDMLCKRLMQQGVWLEARREPIKGVNRARGNASA